ncbi:NADH-quinone oxidoreductase subunit J [Buchnera aphidicola]|uniref:NADH-quinone oxidoreductase subunit J n=1 Tax=Buchnera aphidicola TaxID=9 RepID=UPI003463F66A
MQFVFYVSSCIAILSTILVIFQKNAIYALLYLIISMLSISTIFFALGAFFIGALEVIIYAGAIMVLFVFVIMVLNSGENSIHQETQYFKYKLWIVPGILSCFLFILMLYVVSFLRDQYIHSIVIDSKFVGISLFGPYLLLVELLSMILLSALVVVFHIGKDDNTKYLDEK